MRVQAFTGTATQGKPDSKSSGFGELTLSFIPFFSKTNLVKFSVNVREEGMEVGTEISDSVGRTRGLSLGLEGGDIGVNPRGTGELDNSVSAASG